MANPYTKIVANIATIAKKTAQQQSPIVSGVVIGRNPDGSLIVSDGRGGCLRQAPKANVKIGQRIVLGTEPGLGQQTNLPQIDVTIDGSTVPCPDDPRPNCSPLIGVLCPPPVSASYTGLADLFEIALRDRPILDVYPGDNGDWRNRLDHGHLAGTPDGGQLFDITASFGGTAQVGQSLGRRTTSYTSTFTGAAPFADQAVINCERVFLAFTTPIPTGARVTGATLRIPLLGNADTKIHSDHNDSIHVVPSTHNGDHADVTNFGTLVEDAVMGEALISDIIAAGTGGATPYTYDIPLDPDLVDEFVARDGGVTKMALVMRLDSDPDSVLPSIGLFSTGLETEASVVPDDQVHVNPGNYVIDHVTYSSPGATHNLSQQDANGHTLSGSEAYVAAAIQVANGGVVLVKGEVNGGRPVNPHGGIILSWITVSCSFSTVVSNGDIVFEPTGRPFANVGNPNETRFSYDKVQLDTFRGNIALLIDYELGQSA